MSAVELLTKAVEYDTAGRRLEAIKLYQSGVEVLLRQCKAELEPTKKKHFQSKIEQYLQRAEEIKAKIKSLSTQGYVVDKAHILENSTGHSYSTILGKYLDDKVIEIDLEEPYIREYYQICNLVIFCELIVEKCRNLKFINVTTVKDTRPQSEQSNGFHSLATSLQQHRNITLNIDYSENLHDRQILLSNGYTIKIGRGLNFFKKPANKFSLGVTSYIYRECLETNVDVFFTENKI